MRLKKYKRIISMFMLVNFCFQVLTPTVGYALTGGPSAPEFSSFEPVDTTDMVNLATGDLVYNMSILEVPGPEGGYPLSLSYHSGIKLDQEASWVGLGWTLNAGAINRSVDGVPDDNYQTKRSVKDYWGGGEQTTHTYSYGLSESRSGIGLSYSLAKTNDTYRGFSSNSYFSAAFNPVQAVAAAIPARQSVLAEIRPSLFGQLDRFIFSSLSSNSNVGFTISSDDVKTFATIGGQQLGQNNGSAGKISSYTKETDGWQFGFPIPIAQYVSLAFSGQRKDYYTRYWSDEGQNLFTFGALYPGASNQLIGSDGYIQDQSEAEFLSYSFDMYDMYDGSTSASGNVEDNPIDPSRQSGGAFPAYDRFDVMAQGIGGVMKPFNFDNGALHGQNIYVRDRGGNPALDYPIVEYKSMRNFSGKKVDFRFLNDFSNKLTINPSDITVSLGPTLSVNEHAITASESGFDDNVENQHLAGSKHIEWFTNLEIVSGEATTLGFIDYYESRSDRRLDFDLYENYLQPEALMPLHRDVAYGQGSGSFKTDKYSDDEPYADLQVWKYASLKPKMVDLRKKIGGFMVTNESGVTYHYALPVYNYNEYTRSKLKKPRKGVSTFREQKNDDPYAYTWLLTAITGPDFVDRNNNGVLDDDDWGYWVKFDYGRWADSYQWRTPHSGYANELESEYETFSYGIKELYYLDAIETRTHKAIFVKSIRKDGRGVTSRLEGGSKPRNYYMKIGRYAGSPNTDFISGYLDFSVSPVCTMKLDEILLFDKKDLEKIQLSKSTGSKYMEATTDSPYLYYYKGDYYEFTNGFTNEVTSITEDEDAVVVKYHNGNLVYDDGDVEGIKDEMIENSLRVIRFNKDYSLADQVPNSIAYHSDFVGGSNCDAEWPDDASSCFDPLFSQYPCRIEGYQFYGGDPLGYYQNLGNTCQVAQEGQIARGEFIEYEHLGKLTLNSVKTLGKGGADLIPATSFVYSKNPSYRTNMYDEWGYYKNDFSASIEGHTRKTTQASAAELDAWTLTRINSPVGASINFQFEPNNYGESAYNDFSMLSIEYMTALRSIFGPDLVKLSFREKGLDLSKWFTVNDPIDIKALLIMALTNIFSSKTYGTEREIYMGDSNDTVVSVEDDFVIVHSQALYNLLQTKEVTYPVDGKMRSEPHLASGFVKIGDPITEKFGGGIRVSSISLINGSEVTMTQFDYNDPNTNGSSGVTSFKPFSQPSIEFKEGVKVFDDILTDNKFKNQRKELEQHKNAFLEVTNIPIKDLLVFMREVPGPGVLYEYVTIKAKTNSTYHDNYEVHHFNTFKKSMVARNVLDQPTPSADRTIVTVTNNAIDVGQILDVKRYSTSGSLISTTNYGYLYDQNTEPFETSLQGQQQGIVDQSFHKYITIKEFDVNLDVIPNTATQVFTRDKGVVSKRRDRSNALTSIEEIDAVKGITSKVRNLKFDLFSGNTTETSRTDSYGNTVLTKTIPAHEKYPLMGLKIFSPLNKHMLSQSAAEYTYKVDALGAPTGLIAGSVQTWSDQIRALEPNGSAYGIWRKQSSYQWNGSFPVDSDDGTYPISDFTEFDFVFSNNNTKWQKTSEATLTNVYSRTLEAKDINGNYAANRMDPNNKYVIASSSNASYYEMASSGAEFSSDNLVSEGGVSRGNGNPSSARAHTGKYSLLTLPGINGQGFTYSLARDKANTHKPYRTSVWVYAPGEAESQAELDKIQLVAVVNGVEQAVHPTVQKNKSKSWYLLNLDFNPEGADAVVKCVNNTSRGVYFDDFRVHPLDGNMITYVYDDFSGELIYLLDENNVYTHFEYDAAGRLVRTSREQMNFDFGPGKETFKADRIVNEVIYNYGKSN